MGTVFVIVDNTDIVFECGSGKSAVLIHCQQVSISVVEGEHRCGIECFADTGVFPWRNLTILWEIDSGN